MLALLVAWGLLAGAFAFPDAAIASGTLQPVPHARGVPQGEVFPKVPRKAPHVSKEKKEDPGDRVAAESAPSQVYGGHFGGGGGGGGRHFGGGGGLGGGGGSYNGNPTKTIFVNVPQENYPSPEPIAAGPPRKHYRIVFIRSPVPPLPQPILPPRVEQKTLIYVLHPRQTAGQSVVEVPDIKHDPQVYFIQYDNEPPTAQELQDLVQNTIGGSGDTNINYGSSGVFDGPPSPANVLPPSSQPVYAASSSVENSLAPYQASESSKIHQAKVAQTFSQKLTRPEILKAQSNPRDSLKISKGFQQFNHQQQQRPKFVHTRATSPEVTRENSRAGNAPKQQPSRLRGPVFTPKRKQEGDATKRHSQVSLEPFVDHKSTFRNAFRARPFRFGSKLKAKQNEAHQPSNEPADPSSI